MKLLLGAIFLTSLVLVSAGDANAKRKYHNPTTITTTTTTLPAAPTPVVTQAEIVDVYCTTYCQPADWTLVAGSTCDYVKATCLADDGTGQPNCEWSVKSCD